MPRLQGLHSPRMDSGHGLRAGRVWPGSTGSTTLLRVPGPKAGILRTGRAIGKESPLERNLLGRLSREPARFRDLKPLIEGRYDDVLTHALDRLEDGGYVARRSDRPGPSNVGHCHITALGAQAFSTIQLLEDATRRFTL